MKLARKLKEWIARKELAELRVQLERTQYELEAVRVSAFNDSEINRKNLEKRVTAAEKGLMKGFSGIVGTLLYEIGILGKAYARGRLTDKEVWRVASEANKLNNFLDG